MGHATAACRSTTRAPEQLLGSYDERVWKLEFHPDGTQLVISTNLPASGPAELPQPSVRLVDAATFADQPVQLGGIPEGGYVSAPHYSADGRFVGAAFEGVGGGEDSAVAVWDLASPQRPVLRFDLPGPGYELALSPDGSLLYVGNVEPPRVTTYDVATGRQLHSVSIPGRLVGGQPRRFAARRHGGTEIVHPRCGEPHRAAAGCRVTPSSFERFASRRAANCSPRARTIAPPSSGTSPPDNAAR